MEGGGWRGGWRGGVGGGGVGKGGGHKMEINRKNAVAGRGDQKGLVLDSVADPERCIPDPDPAIESFQIRTLKYCQVKMSFVYINGTSAKPLKLKNEV
jgi:hypothetical protein